MLSGISMGCLYLAVALNHLAFGRFGSTLIYWLRFRSNPNVDLGKSLGQTSVDVAHFRTTQLLGAAYLTWLFSLALTWFSAAFRESTIGRPLLKLSPECGWIICAIAFAGMITAQLSMGRAFRIGQDDSAASSQRELRTNGFLRFSRNPIYVFSFLYLLGATLWAPGPIPLFACVVFGLGIHGLVRREEAFLLRQFGEDYLSYCKQTPRYILLRSLPTPSEDA